MVYPMRVGVRRANMNRYSRRRQPPCFESAGPREWRAVARVRPRARAEPHAACAGRLRRSGV